MLLGPSKLVTALAVIISVTLFAIIVEVIYLLCRRCASTRRPVPVHRDLFVSSGKSFHFLWWKKHSRIEPREASSPASLTSSPSQSPSPPELDLEGLGWPAGGNYYGLPRVLFTIKEEEREGVDTENCSSSERECKFNAKTRRARIHAAVSTRTNGSTGLEVEEKEEEVKGVAIEVINEATPFSTPSDSPPYFTPASSPDRATDMEEN